MPSKIFEQALRAAGYQARVRAITKGGYKLSSFADPEDEYGAMVKKALDGSQTYDFVILQEQSYRSLVNAPAFYEAVRTLSKRIREIGAKPLLYATWGRKTGSDLLETHGWTNESMTWKLAAAYRAIGEELGIPVAYAGLAFYEGYTKHPEIDLYNPDLSHPSYAGSFLAAMTLLARMLDLDPTAVPFTGDLGATDAATLASLAKKATFDAPVIPREYQTESVNV